MSNAVVKAGLISGSLSLVGDLLAQVLTNLEKDVRIPLFKKQY